MNRVKKRIRRDRRIARAELRLIQRALATTRETGAMTIAEWFTLLDTAALRRFAGIVVVLFFLGATSASACWTTWAWDTHPNTFATKVDLDECVAHADGRMVGDLYYIDDLHKTTGYAAVYAPALAARGQENLGTIARTSVRNYYVLIDIERPAPTKVEYRERTVTVPVERVVERAVPPAPLPALRAEPTTDDLWNGDQPYALISDTVMTTLRSTGVVISKGAGDDEVLSLPCLTDPESTRRVAFYGRASSQFAATAAALTTYWVLLSVTRPPTVEIRDRQVPVLVDRPVEEPNPTRIFIERNMSRAVVLALLLLGFLFIVLPYVHYQLHLRKTMLRRMFR